MKSVRVTQSDVDKAAEAGLIGAEQAAALWAAWSANAGIDTDAEDKGRSKSRTGGRSIESFVLSLFEIPLAVMLGYAVTMAVFWVGCHVIAKRCVDVAGMPWLLTGVAFGVIAALAYWVTAFRLGDQMRRRLVLDAIVVALGVAPNVIAWTNDRLEEHKRPAVRYESHPRMAK